jgi:hypothetical protein
LLLKNTSNEATKGEGQNPMVWGEKEKKGRPLKRIKRRLPNAPALGLPDMTKPFLLYVHERLGAVGVLT